VGRCQQGAAGQLRGHHHRHHRADVAAGRSAPGSATCSGSSARPRCSRPPWGSSTTPAGWSPTSSR
jgi:hypothetical protein